jgi:hypothetical protein
MRALLFLAVIVLVLALVGWIKFFKDQDRAGVSVETEKVRQDTKQAMEAGADLLKDAGQAVDRPKEAPSNPPKEPASSGF